MKEQLAKMTIIELVRTAHNYSTSIKQTGVYSELVREMASRLEALNLAHIGAVAALNSTEKERDQLAAECAALKSVDTWMNADEVGGAAAEKAIEDGSTPDEATREGVQAVIDSIKTPATDRFLAEQRAIGVEMFAKGLRVPGDDAFMDAIAVGVAGAADNFAAQLRNEVKV